MKNVNKRFYKRMVALLLVVAMIIPIAFSNIGSRAEGEESISATFDWTDNKTLKVTLSGADDVNVTDISVSNLTRTSVTDNFREAVFSTGESWLRKDTELQLTVSANKITPVLGTDEEGNPKTDEEGNPVYVDKTEDVSSSILSGTTTTKVPENTFTVGIDDINATLEGDSVKLSVKSPAYLKDFDSSCKVYYGDSAVSEDVNLVEDSTQSIPVSNTNGKVLKVKFNNGSEKEVSGSGAWKDDTFKISVNDSNIIELTKNDNNAADIKEYASSFSIKVGDNEKISGLPMESLNGTKLEEIGAKVQYVNKDDIVTIEFENAKGSASVITGIDSLKAKKDNYYSFEVNGSNVIAKYSGETDEIKKISGKYAVLISEANKDIVLESAPGYALTKIDDVIIPENTDRISVDKKDDKIVTIYNYGKVESDNVTVKVDTFEMGDIFSSAPSEAYPLVPYTFKLKDEVPKYLDYKYEKYKNDDKLEKDDENKLEIKDGEIKINTENVDTDDEFVVEVFVEAGTKKITLKNQPIKVKINDDFSHFVEGLEGVEFWNGSTLFLNKNYTISFVGDYYIQYKIQHDKTKYEFSKLKTGWDEISGNSPLELDVADLGEGKSYLYFRTLDKESDNPDVEQKYNEICITVIVDTTAPVIEEDSIKCYVDEEEKDDLLIPANSTKKLVFSVYDKPKTEEIDSNDVSGFKNGEYILKYGNGKNYEYEKGKTINGTIDSSSVEVIVNSDTPVLCSDDEDVYICIYLYDNAGNKSTEYKYPFGELFKLSVVNNGTSGTKKYEEGEYANAGDTVKFTVLGDDNLVKYESKEFESDEAVGIAVKDNKEYVSNYNIISNEKDASSKYTKYVVEYTVPSDKEIDGTHTIQLFAKDKAGNVAESDLVTLIFDNTNPVVNFSDIIVDNEIINESVTADKRVNLFGKVEENNPESFVSNVKVIGASGKEDATIKSEIETAIENAFKGNDYSNVTIPEGAYEEISYELVDKAGNTSGTIKKSFTFDNTKPNTNRIRIQKTTDKGQETKNYNNYQVFDSRVMVTIETKDVISGLKPFDSDASKSGIVVTADEVDKYGESSNIKYGSTAESDKYKSKFVFYVNPNYRGKIAIKLTDYAGNVLQKELAKDSENGWVGAISDSLAADITVSTPNAKKIFNNVAYYNASDVARVKIVAIDNISGLNKIRLTNVAADSVNDIPNIGTKFDVSYPSGNITTDEQTINKDFTTDGAYQIKVVATDNAGNEIEDTSSKFIVDTKDPVLTVSYSSSEEFNNTSVSSDIKIDELNLDGASSKITIYRNEAVYKTVSNLEAANKVSFDEDGDYYIVVDAVDKAGNSSTYNGKQEGKIFTVDKTAPKLTLTYNNNNVQNGKYYNAERIGTLTVVEHNFEAQGITITVNGSQVSAGFSNNGGDSYSANIPFNEENDYTLTITGVDKAGNHEEASISDEFTVDLTDPEITIANVEEDALYSGTVNPSIEVTDRYYDNTGTKITLATSRNSSTGKGIEGSYTASTIANGERFVYSNFKNDEANDDYYLLKVVATDLSGRSSEKTIGFMVNRFGSYFTLDDYTAALVDKKYTNLEGDEDIVIAAHNLAKIDESTVYFTVGEDTEVLKENEGYKVDTKAGDDHWNVSTYRFEKSLFESEGEYNIVVSTKDSEGNVADNESKEVPVTFVIDRTAPEYIVNGIENEQNYEDQDKVSGAIELHDNIGVAKAVVDIDGTKSTYEGKELDEMNNSIPVEFGKGSHTVKIKVYDLAGNESKDDDGITFSVAQNAAERAIEGAVKNFWWIFVIIGALAVGGIIFFVVAKRRKEEQ